MLALGTSPALAKALAVGEAYPAAVCCGFLEGQLRELLLSGAAVGYDRVIDDGDHSHFITTALEEFAQHLDLKRVCSYGEFFKA